MHAKRVRRLAPGGCEERGRECVASVCASNTTGGTLTDNSHVEFRPHSQVIEERRHFFVRRLARVGLVDQVPHPNAAPAIAALDAVTAATHTAT